MIGGSLIGGRIIVTCWTTSRCRHGGAALDRPAVPRHAVAAASSDESAVCRLSRIDWMRRVIGGRVVGGRVVGGRVFRRRTTEGRVQDVDWVGGHEWKVDVKGTRWQTHERGAVSVMFHGLCWKVGGIFGRWVRRVEEGGGRWKVARLEKEKSHGSKMVWK